MMISSLTTAATLSAKSASLWSGIKPALERCLSLLPSKWQRQVRKSYASRGLANEPEPREFAVLRHLVEDGSSVVDAGANHGIYTKFFSRYVSAKVISIEPIPSTFDILHSNVTALGLHNVQLFQCALSDRSGTVTMEIPQDDRGKAVHYLARIRYSDASHPPVGSSYSVPARTLDAIITEADLKVGLIKCDVEMHEFEVLSGALAVIRRDVPAIYVEIQPDFKTKKSQRSEIINLLGTDGYAPYICMDGRVAPWTVQTQALDLLFLTPLHRHRLARHGILIAES